MMFSFQKEERLKSRKVIGQLFKEGNSFSSFPLRIVWVKMDEPRSKFPAQMALTVPKKAFPKAVDRNRIRRRIREAYRLNKHLFYEKINQTPHSRGQIGLMWIYVAKETLDFQTIENGVKKGLNRLAKSILEKD